MSPFHATSALAILIALAFGACDGGDDEAAPVTRERVTPIGLERGVPGAHARHGPRPNVIVVMTDDQDYRSLRVMPSVRTLLARRGTSFTHYYATLPLCCPARATLLTGQYAHNHGVFGNKPPDGGYPALARKADTLGVWLQRAGYRTAWIGKFLNGYGHEGEYAIPPGWDRWAVPVELTELRMWGYRLNEDGEIVAYGGAPADYQTDVLADKAIDYVGDAAGHERPFFLVLAPTAPHDELDTIDTGDRDPRPAPRHRGSFTRRDLRASPSFNEGDVSDKPRAIARLPRLDDRDLRALLPQRLGRLESLLAVDEAVRGLVRNLRRTGQLERTAIVFTSDNGLVLGEHRLATAKSVPYEEATRVPLIVRGPGFHAGARVPAPVGNVDLAPTILDLAEARPTRRLDGASLLRAARDPRSARARPVLLEAEAWRGLRLGRWSYVEHRDGAKELYDLADDPFQLHNLARAPALRAIRERLAGRLAQLRRCAGRACR